MPVQSGTGDSCEAMACKECLHQGGQSEQHEGACHTCLAWAGTTAATINDVSRLTSGMTLRQQAINTWSQQAGNRKRCWHCRWPTCRWPDSSPDTR